MLRRYKSYTAETGVFYRYCFAGRRSVVRPAGVGPGSDYIFVVTADQGPPLSVRVFVSQTALTAWCAACHRQLDPSEQYAAAKMRLFRAFDEVERLGEESLNLVVDETNVAELLEVLDLT